MRIRELVLGAFVFSLIFTSCSKKEEFESKDLKPNDVAEVNETFKDLSNTNKEPDFDAGSSDPACVDGGTFNFTFYRCH